MKIKAVLFSAIIVVFTSCVPVRGVKAWMDAQKLPAVAADGSAPAAVTVTANVASTAVPTATANVKALKNYVIPLPFVGLFQHKFDLKAGQNTLAPLGKNIEAACSKELQAQLPASLAGHYALQLTVDSTNFHMIYTNKGSVVWLVLLQLYFKKEYILPVDLKIAGKYELLEDGKLIHSGTFTQSKQLDQKITGDTNPYWHNDPTKTYTQNAVASQYGFKNGGTINTLNSGAQAGFHEYNQLITDLAKDVVTRCKSEMH